ncbi:hypothetical protein GOBAR_DD07868 [Gossypium barbadense]|nr:hypothetical protein GOBAR_DD07868 [Gossypium barbadense]
MFVEEEYYINLYVGGKFVRDPHVRYFGDYPDTISYFELGTLQDNFRVMWNNSITIDMLNYWVTYKEIDLYVEHEIDATIFTTDDLLLTAASVEGGKGVEGLNGEGVKVAGSKCGEVDAIGQGGEGGEVEVDEGGECVEGLNGEGLNSDVKEADEEGVKDENDKELQEARKNLKEYSMCCKKELKIIKNEPNRLHLKNANGEYLQVTVACPSACNFRNKMFNVKVITEHFEANIKDHPKIKLREIQRRVTLEINVNVNMTRCRRAKKMVKNKLDYADKLRLKIPGSTINMAVTRVTTESPPHFKRFYVCFEALKRGWKER